METATQEASNMTAKQTRIEEIYFNLKLEDRMTPGRTPWQTLKKRAADIAAQEVAWNEAPISVENRNLSRAW